MRKILMGGTTVALIGGCLVFLLLLGSGNALAATSASTAQSAMFNNTASGNFVITGNEVWQYDRETAGSTYFTNAWDGNTPTGPVVGCTGAPSTTGKPCNSAQQPATPSTPSAPDPTASKLTPHISNNSCNFWGGTALDLVPGPDTTYTETASVTVDVTIGTQTGHWRFTWTYTYNITLALGAGPFPEHTAWILESSNSATAEVSVGGFFAGESTVKKAATRASPWTFKNSFTMTDDLGASRLVNPVAHIFDPSAVEICTLTINTQLVNPTTSTGVDPYQPEDYFYTQNAGSNGPAGQLVNNGTVLDIENGAVCAPGADNTLGTVDDLCDNFSGNNATLGEKAVITGTDPAFCSISSAGTYTLNVTGTLKGVGGAASLPVSVTSSLCISAGTCQVCP